MPCSNHLWQNAIKQLKLATASEDVLSQVFWLQEVQEKIRMVANLSQLHHCISQSYVTYFTGGRISSQFTLISDTIVNYSLPGRQVNLDNHFYLIWEFLLYLRFDSSKKKRPQDLMKSIDDQKLLFFGQLKSLLLIGIYLGVS